jgi:ribosomal protein S24E
MLHQVQTREQIMDKIIQKFLPNKDLVVVFGIEMIFGGGHTTLAP